MQFIFIFVAVAAIVLYSASHNLTTFGEFMDYTEDSMLSLMLWSGIALIFVGSIYVLMRFLRKAELRQRMSGTGVEVERNGDQIKLVMPGAITFPTGKADIQPSFYNTLGQLSGSFSNFPDSNLIVTGHTDSTGSADANLGLSARRAEAVAQYLRASGIDSSRIQTTGVGSSQPVASNATPEGRAQNRRVEINVVPRQVAQR